MRNGIQRDAGFHSFFLYNRTSAVFIWRLMGSSASSKRISHSGTIPHAPSAVCVVRMGLLGVTRRWRECMRLVVCLYNRSSAVVRVPPVSRGRQANPVLTYETALRRFLGDGFFAMTMAIRRRRQPPKGGCIIIAPGWLAYLGAVEE